MPQQPDPYLAALDAVQQPQQADPFLAALDAVQGKTPPPPDKRSLFSRAYDVAFTPPEAVTRTIGGWADAIDTAPHTPRGGVLDALGAIPEVASNLFSEPVATIRGGLAGAVQGFGNLLTPGDVALTALNLRAVKPVIQGIRGASAGVSALNRAAGLATAVRGGERLIDAESFPEGAAGVAQLALGGAALRAGRARPQPAPRRPVRGELPAGARYVVTEDGRVITAGTDVPMQRGPDGSFVRGVPAQPAQREVRGLLPGGRTRFVAGESGAAVPVEQADDWLRALDEVQGHTPAESGVRGQRAAVVERDVDVTRPTHEAITVRQYSSDPNAADTPLLGDDDLRVLRVMRDDLQEFAPERGRLVPAKGETTASIYAPGTRGSGVGDDIRVISGEHVSNAKITQAIDDLLAGKMPTNKLHIAAIDAVRGYREGRGGYKGTTLPIDAADAWASRRRSGPDLEPELARRSAAPSLSKGAKIAEVDEGVRQLEELLERTGGAGARTVQGRGTLPASKPQPGGGGAPAAVDDFDRFSAMFDEVADMPGGGREPGEAGFLTAQLGTHLGGAVAGGAAGAAAGDEDDSALRQGLKIGAGIVAGAAAPSLFRRPGVTSVAAQKVARAASETPGVVVPIGTARVPHTGHQGQPIDEPLKGFEPFLAKFSNPLVRDGVAKVITENGGFAQQRRGEIGARDLGKFANDVRVNVEKVLPKGTALTGEAITSYARALQQTTKKVEDLAALVNSGQARDADVLALEVARAEQQVIAQSLVGARAEAGRALASFNFWRGVLDTGNVEMIRNAVTPLREEAARIAKGLTALPDDPLTRYRWLQAQSKVSPWAYARTYYVSNLLSGPKTHARNVLGNLFNAVADTVTLPVAAGIDAAKSAVKGTPRTVRLTELPATVQGALVGVEKGFHDAMFAFRHGIHPAALAQRVELAATKGKLDLPAPELPGGGYNPLNWPFRALHGPDAFFKAVARESELSAILFNVAKNEGKAGQALLDRVAELRGGMTPDAIAIRQQAGDYALRRVFLEEPGDITKRITLLAEAVPGSWLVAPFIRIGAAITRQGAQFSPVGFLMKTARQTGRAGTQAQARAAAGSMAAGYLFWLASTGRLSGDGPREPSKRAALMESGWKPNSIKVGDSWLSYQTMQPLSIPMSVIANATEAWQARGSKAEEAPSVVFEVLARTANSFLDNSFMQGTLDLVEAMKEPGRMSRVAGRVAFGFVPGSSAIRTVQQARDPVVRQPEGIVENITAQMPGLSEDVQPKVTRFGEPVVREGGPARRALDPFLTSTEKDDPVAKELDRLGVTIGLPSDKLKLPEGMSLTPDEETALKQAKGRALRQRLEKMFASKGYQQVPDRAKAKWIDRIKRQVANAESKAAVRRVKARQSTPSIPTAPGERMFTGRTLGRRQVEALAREFGTSYAEARAAVIERGGTVQDR